MSTSLIRIQDAQMRLIDKENELGALRDLAAQLSPRRGARHQGAVGRDHGAASGALATEMPSQQTQPGPVEKGSSASESHGVLHSRRTVQPLELASAADPLQASEYLQTGGRQTGRLPDRTPRLSSQTGRLHCLHNKGSAAPRSASCSDGMRPLSR